MKFLHTSDLHIGKTLNGWKMEEDQQYILEQIIDIAVEEKVDGVIIAGDIYDKASETTPASMSMFDDFITKLSEKGFRVYAVSGNHDSMDMLAYGSRMFNNNNVFIAGDFDGNLKVFEYNGVQICLLPFIKPAFVRNITGKDISSYEEAVSLVLQNAHLKDGKKILVTHQYVVDGDKSPLLIGSERNFVGGTESINVGIFKDFDYVALGHIHTAQSMGRDNVRYSGTPLKYSLNEKDDEKSVTIVEVGDNITTYPIALHPKRDLREIVGTLDQVVEVGSNSDFKDDYVYIKLTDQNLNDKSKLDSVFSRIVEIGYISNGSADMDSLLTISEEDVDIRSEFSRFYESKKGAKLTEKQMQILEKLFEEVGI